MWVACMGAMGVRWRMRTTHFDLSFWLDLTVMLSNAPSSGQLNTSQQSQRLLWIFHSGLTIACFWQLLMKLSRIGSVIPGMCLHKRWCCGHCAVWSHKFTVEYQTTLVCFCGILHMSDHINLLPQTSFFEHTLCEDGQVSYLHKHQHHGVHKSALCKRFALEFLCFWYQILTLFIYLKASAIN